MVQNFAGEKEEFLLFASLFEVTMIDPSIGTRLVTFELSIGETFHVKDNDRYLHYEVFLRNSQWMFICEFVCESAVMYSRSCIHTGNHGKAADIVVKSKKSAQQEDLSEERQALLDSEDELEREELVELSQRDRSVTSPRRPQGTEYDRYLRQVIVKP